MSETPFYAQSISELSSQIRHGTLSPVALTEHFLARLEALDAGLGAFRVPTTMIPTLPTAEVDASMETYAERNLQYLRNTAIGNILNLCGLSLPCGFTSQGLPIGLMIYGKPDHEDIVLRVGYAYEQATEWHRKMPDLSWVVAG